MISIRNVNHEIAGSRILHDINLDIPSQGLTAIIGPNGAGKSTLLSLIARMSPLSEGEITIDGDDVNKTPSSEIALKLAIVSQQNIISSRLNVRDLIGFGRWPHHKGRMSADDHAAVDEALNAFNLGDLQHRFLDELSGGQQQRAFVAMGFAQSTDWLLLDEPLNNLDMFHARSLMQRIFQMSRDDRPRPRKVVLVAHEINYVAAWADYIVALKAGRVVAKGNAHEVLTSPVLSELYDMEIQVEEHAGRPLILHHV